MTPRFAPNDAPDVLFCNGVGLRYFRDADTFAEEFPYAGHICSAEFCRRGGITKKYTAVMALMPVIPTWQRLRGGSRPVPVTGSKSSFSAGVELVLPIRTDPEVTRANARWGVAGVAHHKPWLDVSNEHFVGHPMRPATVSELPVPISRNTRRPKPASIGDANLCHEACEQLQVGSGERNGRIEVSHGEPPIQVPVVRSGLSVSALGRAALYCTAIVKHIPPKG